jgi:hypothetical protein
MPGQDARGFSFRNLPTVIDPASEIVEIVLAPWTGSPENPGRSERAFYRKLVIPDTYLPFTKTLEFANIYGDAETWDTSVRAFAYSADGILRAVLYRDTIFDVWNKETMPEEFTGEHVSKPSVRLMFDDRAAASEVAEIIGRLQAAQQSDIDYSGSREEAAKLLRHIMMASEPRFLVVADPVQDRVF